VNSEATGNAFVAAGGQRARVRIAYNGIDAATFAPRRDDSLRRALGLGDVPVIGVFSRLAPWKGQHTLLAALESVPDAHALVVGGPLFGPGDAAYAERLHARAAEALPGRVHFLGFRSDIPALLQACDVVVHTSVAPEPFGRVIVEAMLSERPVVAAGGGGADEIIRHGETGILVVPDDPRALARAIRFLLRQPGEARRIAAAGRRSAAERFTPERMLAAVRAAVEEVVWDW
jgi:glycosyltransferase involved in cell wall biosynthesis